MVTNISSMPSSSQPNLLRPVVTRVEYQNTNGEQYSSVGWQILEGIKMDRITHRIGPTPSEAVITVPVDYRARQSTGTGAHVPSKSRLADGNTSLKQRLNTFSTKQGIRLWSKVRIFGRYRVSERSLVQAGPEQRLFVGYVTSLENSTKAQDETNMTVVCQDGRVLLENTPAQGLLFFNPEANETVFIRDARVVFNEGERPDRFEDRTVNSHSTPKFVNWNWNRFIDQSDDPNVDGLQIYDGALEDSAVAKFVQNPSADKWRPGDIWNYLRNLIDRNLMVTNRIYDDPTSADENELPPIRSDEIVLPVLTPTGDTKHMYNDWFEPRAFIGAANQTGFGTAVSGVGEFTANGQPYTEVLFELCRRVGNYTYTAYYDDEDRCVIQLIRTTLANQEDQTAPVGLRGGSRATTGGKELKLILPSNNANKFTPTVADYVLRSKSNAYANRVHMKAGTQWVQVTFSTVGSASWVDDTGQVHQAYDPPGGEWGPRTEDPTLIPAWTEEEQDSFLTEFAKTGNEAINYPDVFRTWIVPQTGFFKIDWLEFLDDSGTIGYRRILERDRMAQERLSVRLFQGLANIFRNRAQAIPVTVWRAFRGIRIDGTEDAYGNSEGDPVNGYADWYPTQAGFKVLTDGRLGIQFDDVARLNINFPFESDTTGILTPYTWNKLTDPDEARHYEFMVTMAISLDEDLWNQINIPNTGTRSISRYGPLLEVYKDAGNEYGTERAIHSLIPKYNNTGANKIVPTPPVSSGDPTADEADRYYRQDAAEVLARNQIMANRYAVSDGEYDLTLDHIRMGITPGDYFSELRFADGDRIPVNAIVDSHTLDFIDQKSYLHLANLR